VDRISLSHEAKSRKGFALGAVLAAEFSENRKGIFTMHDMLKTLGI
jgi:4-hydroxy-tetrahydrodipicolinate reductase